MLRGRCSQSRRWLLAFSLAFQADEKEMASSQGWYCTGDSSAKSDDSMP